MKRLGLALLGLAAVTPVQADPRDDAMAAVNRCTGIPDAKSRLACYDSAVMGVRGAMLAPAPAAPAQPSYPPPVPQHSFTPAGPAAQAAIPPPAPPPRQSHAPSGFFSKIFGDGGPARPPQTSVPQFGSESIAYHGDRAYPSHREGDTIDAISARLVSYRFAGTRLIVSLDNGQDWIETSGDSLVGYLAHPALYYSAQIERNSGGSYAMTLTGIFRPIAVRRIR